MHHKEVALKIEHFYNDEDIELRVGSVTGMQTILQNVAEHRSHVALYYNRNQKFILTVLLGVDEDGMWLDVGPLADENELVLRSDKVTFVSAHEHLKIQFVTRKIEYDTIGGRKAFFIEMPEYLLRIQRRAFYRAPIPATDAVRCLIPLTPEKPGDAVVTRELPLIDISGGGVGLLCAADEADLLPMKVFPDCKIVIPGEGTLTVTLEVRNGIDFTDHNDMPQKHVGCRFVRHANQLDNAEMDGLLQRYITHLQIESLSLPSDDKQ